MMSDPDLSRLPDLPQVAPLDDLCCRLWAIPNVVALWLGGSFARGEADAVSDVDLRIAVSAEAFPEWQNPNIDHLFGGKCVGHRSQNFSSSGTLYHTILSTGDIFDVWVQSITQPPPEDVTLVLACRDAGFERLLHAAQLETVSEARDVDGEEIRQVIVSFWIDSLKHRKVLRRDLDPLVIFGLQIEKTVLLRLWYVSVTNKDVGAFRPTIHTLTRMVRPVEQALGLRMLEIMGLPADNSANVRLAIETHRDEVSRVGKELAVRFGFEYPAPLEETVRRISL